MKNGHFFGWYYGSGHFIAKVLPFVLDGLSQNAQFIVVFEPQILALLQTALRSNGVTVRPDTFIPAPLTDLLHLQRTQGVQGLRKGLLAFLEQARARGFQQLRITGQVTRELALTDSSLEQFLQWEKIYHQACTGLPIASLCMYDAALSVDHDALLPCHDEPFRPDVPPPSTGTCPRR